MQQVLSVAQDEVTAGGKLYMCSATNWAKAEIFVKRSLIAMM